MNENKADIKVKRWFYHLPFEVRYRFSSQWMADEAAGISIAKLAECVEGDKKNSDTLVKSFRSFDLNTQKLKKVARPESGYTENDVYLICNAINVYRQKNGRDDKVSVSEFYQHAWDEFGQEYPEGKQEFVREVEPKEAQEVQEPSKNELIKPNNLLVKSNLLPVSIVIRGGFIAASFLILVIYYLLSVQKDSFTSIADYKQYFPGNVVQLRQVNSLGNVVVLEYPEHYLDAGDCYPNLKNKREQSAITSYRQLLRLPLSGLDDMTNLLPKLPAEFEQDKGKDKGKLQSVNIDFGSVHRWYVQKGMINLGISEVCMASMQQVIDYGNKIDDYGIIKQTYVAQGIDFKLVFAADIELQKVENVIATIVSHYSGLSVEIIKEQNQQSIVRRLVVSGPVAVGYISQPMSARISR